MEKLNLFKMMLLLCALIAGSGSMWADEVTYVFTSKDWHATVDSENANWTSGKEGAGYTDGQGVQVTSNTTGANATSPQEFPNISRIIVTYNTNKGAGAGSIVIKVGNNTEKSNSVSYSGNSDGRSADFKTQFDYATPESGKVNITVKTTTNSIYPKSITIFYTDESDTREVVNITDFTANATMLVKGETTKTTVTNDQVSWTPSYTYTSDAPGVATISDAGVITAVSKGTANITATLNIASDDENYKAGSTKSKSIAITVTNPSHKATFSVNGTNISDTEVEEGKAITFPTDPDAIGGKTFVGWTATVIDGTTNETPTTVSIAMMGEEDVTFYALFATAKGEIEKYTDELTFNLIGVTGTSYTSWSGKKSSSDAVYAGESAGGNNSIQLRSQSNAGIVTTTSGGKIRKIVVEWNSNTASGRTLDIYRSTSKFTSSSQLYQTGSNNPGTKDGSIVYGKSTEFTFSKDATYVGLRSSSGAMYIDKLTLYWEKGDITYSDYCTSITETISLNAACTDGDFVYGTYSSSQAFVVPEDVEVSEIAIIDGKLYVEAYNTGDVVPANTGVMVAALEGGDYIVNLSSEEGTSVLGEDNCLQPTGNDGVTAADMGDTDYYYYRLTMKDSKPGFWWKTAEGAGFDLAAHKAFLKVAKSANARGFNIGEDGEATGIGTSLMNSNKVNNEIYNLNGQRIAKPTRGLYIVNGKKVACVKP